MRTDRKIFLSLAALLSLGGATLFGGCSGDTNATSGSGGNGAGNAGTGTAQGGGSSTGEGGDIGFIDAGNGDGSLDPDSACASQTAEATLTKKPVDIIIVVDNSGSMTEEIQGVESNINKNFAQIIEQSGIDYRVILVAKHGSAAGDQSICIEQPLSGIPAGGCATPPADPVDNPPKFYHYDTEIASHNSLCKILTTFSMPDSNGNFPMGWQEHLRPEALKVFIELTDDGISCSANGVTYNDSDTVAGGNTTGGKFDTALLALSPTQFGDATNRNYKFYSIVAMKYNDPATNPWLPTDPMTNATCPTAAGPGTGYQALSILTDSLRFPLCDTTSYDVVFKAIAEGVVAGAKVSCNFPVPPPPMGQTIDLKSVIVQYTPGDMSAPKSFKQVTDAMACTPDAFYIDAAKNEIVLCTDTCGVVQQDATAKIAVLFACDEGGAN